MATGMHSKWSAYLVVIEAGDQRVVAQSTVEERVWVEAKRDVRVEREHAIAEAHRFGQEEPALPPQVIDMRICEAVRGDASLNGSVRATVQEGAVAAS